MGKKDRRKKKESDSETINEYAQKFNDYTSFYFDPAGQWHRCHGDGKSTTAGRFHTETMLGTDGLYHVKIMDGRGTAWNTSYSEAPTAEQIVNDIKAAFPLLESVEEATSQDEL